MSSYFPIPNDFYISEEKKVLLTSSVSLLNYPSNCLIENLRNDGEDVFYCIYFLKDNKWLKHSENRCKFGQFIEFRREDLNLPKNTMAVVVPSKEPDCIYQTKTLPEPHSIRRDKSLVAERASYNFNIKGISSSYQGEYPKSLALIKKSSFFTFDSIRVEKEIGSETWLLLMNLRSNAKDNMVHELSLYNPTNKVIIKRIKVKDNSFTSHLLPRESKNNRDPIFITCPTGTFIPIFISISFDGVSYEISVEHTHPPTELYWGLSKFIGSKNIKERWVKR